MADEDTEVFEMLMAMRDNLQAAQEIINKKLAADDSRTIEVPKSFLRTLMDVNTALYKAVISQNESMHAMLDAVDKLDDL